MKLHKIVHTRFGKIHVLYGSKYEQREYFTVCINVNKKGEDMIVFCIGTLDSAVPHPDYKGKRQYSNSEMIDIWTDLRIPKADILLLSALLPV